MVSHNCTLHPSVQCIPKHFFSSPFIAPYKILASKNNSIFTCSSTYFLVDHSIGSVHGPGDILTCGGCQKQFGLSEIVRFIQHKVRTCPAILAASNSTNRRDNVAVAAAAAALLNNNNLDAKNNHSSLVESPTSSIPCSEDEEDEGEDYSKVNNNNTNNSNNNNIGDKNGGSDAEDENVDQSSRTTIDKMIPVVKPSISAPIISRRPKGHRSHQQHLIPSRMNHQLQRKEGEEPLVLTNKSDASVNTSLSSGEIFIFWMLLIVSESPTTDN